MNQYTDEEIISKCKELWPMADAHRWGRDAPPIRVAHDGDAVMIEVGTMYNFEPDDVPTLTFDKRLELSCFFDTMLVEDTREFEESYGCETCGYGGAYGFIVRVAPGAPYDPSIAALAQQEGGWQREN